MNLIKSEWIKLSSTKALWATSILVVLFSVLFALLMGLGTGVNLNDEELMKDPELYAATVASISSTQAFTGLTAFGLIVIIIQACMMVTSEYGNGSVKTTMLGTPSRWPVPVAKFSVYGVIAAVLALVSQVLSLLTMRWMLSMRVEDKQLLDPLSFSADGVWREIGMNVVYCVLVVLMTIGVGYLIRHTAGAISLMVMWILIVEGILIGFIPWVKDWLPPYMPFKNMDAAVSGTDIADAPWGHAGSLIYFIAWAVVIFVAGVIVLRKRDA